MVLQQLAYKAESPGGGLVKIQLQYTTQNCSNCGHRPKERLPLSVRSYVCVNCTYEADRDVNAARNILSKAQRVWAGRAALCIGEGARKGDTPDSEWSDTAQDRILA